MSGKGNIVQRFYKTKSNEVRWTDTETDLTNKSWCIWSMKLSLSTRCQICAKRWHIPQINGWNRYKCHISIIMFSFLSLTWLFIVFSCTFCLRKQALIRIFFFWFLTEWTKLYRTLFPLLFWPSLLVLSILLVFFFSLLLLKKVTCISHLVFRAMTVKTFINRLWDWSQLSYFNGKQTVAKVIYMQLLCYYFNLGLNACAVSH